MRTLLAWVRRRWQRTPDRTEVLRRYQDLPRIPEWERMQTKAPTVAKPKTIEELNRRYPCLTVKAAS